MHRRFQYSAIQLVYKFTGGVVIGVDIATVIHGRAYGNSAIARMISPDFGVSGGA